MSHHQTETAQPFVAHELTSWVARDGRTYSLVSGQEISEPLRISEQNGTTLRHALKGHGLPVSGTKRQQAVRLANAGVSAAHVETWHTWRGRDFGPCSEVTCLPGAARGDGS